VEGLRRRREVLGKSKGEMGSRSKSTKKKNVGRRTMMSFKVEGLRIDY
jgi:hypothetical protein